MTLSNAEVIRRFAAQQVNRATSKVNPKVYWRSHGLTTSGDGLYSYGQLIARYLAPNLFLKCGDRFTARTGGAEVPYSVTTNQHIGMIVSPRGLRGPVVSFNALESAGVDVRELTADNIVHWTADHTIPLYRESLDAEWRDARTHEAFKAPDQGMLIPEVDGLHAEWHFIDETLLNVKGRTLLCRLDENVYCVIEVPSGPRTVHEAIESLKPAPVKESEAAGVPVLRQGEWFFVPFAKDDADLATKLGLASKTAVRKQSRMRPLPRRDASSRAHFAVTLIHDNRIYARGTVHHRREVMRPYREKWCASGEHRPLRLDGWYAVYPNLEIASWTQSGNFD